jgi:hypothetical protein
MWQYNVIPKLLDRWHAESRGVNELYRSPLHLSTAVHVCKADSMSLAVKLLGGTANPGRGFLHRDWLLAVCPEQRLSRAAYAGAYLAHMDLIKASPC